MRNIIKILMSVLLAVMLVFSMAACKTKTPTGPDGEGDGSQSETPTGTITPDSLEEVDGTHDINIGETNIDFVLNGHSDYRIVTPAGDTENNINFTTSELTYFLSLAAGVSLEVVTDDQVEYSPSSKFISLGDTSLLADAGITVDKTVLGRSGYRIITKDNSVFLVGGGDFGTMYSAYGFLEHMFDFEVYASDEIRITRSDSVKLKNFDITDVPDFTYRMTNYGQQRNNVTFANRQRMNQETNGRVWMGPNGMNWHNTFAYLPKATYNDASAPSNYHPKWYSPAGSQLCFLARGDEDEAALMLDAFMESFIGVINANPGIENITITQEDVNVWCGCDACVAERTKYGTDAATIVKFCNKVSDRLAEYFEANNIERNINIMFFAYHRTEQAPVIQNEDGTYSPIDESVICRDNVFCFYAPIFANYNYSFYDGRNGSEAMTMDAWCALSKELYLWIYSTNFSDYLSTCDTFNSMQANYRFAKAHNAQYMFDQGQWNQSISTGWGHLKTYLNAKLQWNVNLNFNDLTDDFFNNFYKQAAGPMKTLFNEYRAWMVHVREDLGLTSDYRGSVASSRYMPKATVDKFLSRIDEAYAAIEPLRTLQPSLYNTLYDRICVESLAYRKWTIDLYSSKYTESEQIEMRRSFKTDATRIGVSRMNEGTEIGGLWTNWGV